uniref:uncharacterized protein LOC122581953 n=1 Tax=Erigeron canadensis TaxID=72917 RepID=UPI001CB8988F|nr:uncharacterized protein LOC122581953 [Erigeron canadensis]
MEPYLLQQSLLTTTTTTTKSSSMISSLPPNSVTCSTNKSNASSIIFRLILISCIGIISIWANYEASKGFSITIVNDASKFSLARKRFSLLYESNDKATRIVVNTSTFVENLLYPAYNNNNQDSQKHFKKQINSVTLRLAAPTNFHDFVSVDQHSQKPHEYIINLNPSLLEETRSNNDELVVMAVLQGMARVWLWDGKGGAPLVLLNGIVEYITSLAGYRTSELHKFGGGNIISAEKNEICWKDEDRRKVAGFLSHFDHRMPPNSGGDGEMIRRLNKEMRNGWDDQMVDDVLGMTSQHACASYILMNRHHNPYSSV